MLEGGAGRGAGEASMQRWKGALEGGPSRGFQRWKGLQHGFQQRVLAEKGVAARGSSGYSSGPNCPVCHRNHGKGGCRTCGEHTSAQAVYGHQGEDLSRAAAPNTHHHVGTFSASGSSCP